MKNYPFTKIHMVNWKDPAMLEEPLTYPMETIAFIESKMIVFEYFDDPIPRPAIVIHFNTNETATLDAANWSIGFI